MVDVNLIKVESDWNHNFRIINFQDASERGVCYSDAKQVWISLHMHESMNDLIDTINHETLHQAISSNFGGFSKDEMDMSDTMDGEQEHELMKRVTWAMNDWLDFR